MECVGLPGALRCPLRGGNALRRANRGLRASISPQDEVVDHALLASARDRSGIKVLRALLSVETKNSVREQFSGHQQEPGVTTHFKVGTFAALRLEVD
jgi:hypothetical protein